MDKLYGIIRGCPLGIHDLSGTTLDPDYGCHDSTCRLNSGVPRRKAIWLRKAETEVMFNPRSRTLPVSNFCSDIAG